MINILLVRHADTGREEEYQPERTLTVRGEEQARLLTLRLQKLPLQRLISSPFQRAIQTMQPISKAQKLSFETDERVTELIEPEQTRRGLGKENAAFLQDILVAVAGKKQNILVVSHGNRMRSLLATALRIEYELANQFEIGHASLSMLSYDGDRQVFYLTLLNDTSHLGPLKLWSK